MATTTLENHLPLSTPESGKSAEQLFDEQLQAAGLVNISNKVREWIASNPIALNEIGRLADDGFGAKIENNTAAQGLLHSAFAETMALEKLRQNGAARELPLNVHEVIQSTEPEGAREVVVEGVVIPNDLSSLDATPQPAAQEPALRAADHLEQAATVSPAPLAAPAESVASMRRQERSTAVQETTTNNESRGWFQRVRNIGKRGVAATLIAGATVTGVGAGIAKVASIEGQPQSVAAALELASQEKTLEEKKNFFDGAVDVHMLPGRIGNNFGPAVTYEDLRIDTPENREKTLQGFSEMLRGNVDIMVAYMYTFGQAGDKITEQNAAVRLQQLKDLAVSLEDEKNIGARYDAHQKVMEVLNTIQGGNQGKFGPEHISWYIAPDNTLGLDNSVLDNGAEYVDYSITLLADANPTFVKDAKIEVLKNCGRQLGTEELQQLVQFLISKKAPVITTTTFAPSPITSIPHNWNTYPGGGGGGGGGGGTPPEYPPEHPPENPPEVKDYSGGVDTAPGIDPSTVVFRGWTPDPEVAGNGTNSPNLSAATQPGSETGGRADGAAANTDRQVDRAEDGAGENRTEADKEAKKAAEKEAKKQAEADKKAAEREAKMSDKKNEDAAVKRAQAGMDSNGRPTGSSGSSGGNGSSGSGGTGGGNSSGGGSDGGNS